MGLLQRSALSPAVPAPASARRARRRLVVAALTHLFLLVSSVSFVVPFVWLITTSLKADEQLFVAPPVWIPSPIRWENYPRALNYVPFDVFFRNTLIIAGANVVGTLLSCPLVAYGLSRIRWPGREVLFTVVLATMMLPYQVTMIPLFIVFKELGWLETFNPLIVPAFFGTSFFIFLLRQFFMTIPIDLSDAATIDGCSELQTYWRIILPLARPALATVALFTFIANWQDFLGPLVYLRDESMYTLSLGLQRFLGDHGAEWSLLMAASTVVVLPIVFLFFFTQRTFIQGITMTGLKE